MKLVLVTTDLTGKDGWSTYTLNLARIAVIKGYEVHVFVVSATTHPIAGIQQYAFLPRPHAIAWNPYVILNTVQKVRSLLNELKPDVVHVIVEPYLQIWAFMPVKRYRLVATFHGTYARLPLTVPSGIRRLISRSFFFRALKRVTHTIAVSNKTRNIFLAYAPHVVSNDRITVVHNSVAPNTILDRDDAKVVSESLEAVTIGAVKPRKGIHLAIQFLSQWSAERKRVVVYHIVGYRDMTSSYVSRIEEESKKASHDYFSVIFHGTVSETVKTNLLARADLYIHLEEIKPNHTDVEGFGISIIEAASHGVPALVAKESATSEAVDEGKSGLIVDLSNKEMVKNALDVLLLEKAVSKKEVHAWAEKHEPEEIFKAIESLYLPET